MWKKRLFFGVEVKVVYSFFTKEYELVLGLCPKGPPDWDRGKKKKIYIYIYIYKIESETKRWEKKEKKRIFAQEIAQGEATRFEFLSPKFL